MRKNEMNVTARRRVTGQGMTEYIIIVALIAIASIVAVGAFGGQVKSQFSNIAARLGGGDNAAAVTAATATAEGVDTAAPTLDAY